MTTPTTIDVNQAFADERAGQIASALDAPRRAAEAAATRQADYDRRIAEGKLRPLGAGRYEVTDPGSWDNGEILYSRWDNAREQVIILPQHGLEEDENTGVKLYSAVPTWHGLGNIIPGGTSDIDTVLKLSGLDFGVATTPAEYTWNGERRTRPGTYHTVRDDTGDSLGVVGEQYRRGGILQNREAFEFLQDLVDRFDVTWESAGIIRGAVRVFISMRLPNTITIDAEGINDTIIPFIVAINSFNGRSNFEVVATPWRPVCGNTERFAVRDAFTRWTTRHTAGMRDRLDEARRTLGLSLRYFDHFRAEEEALARTNLEIDAFRKLVGDLWPVEGDPAEQTTHAQASRNRREEALVNLYDTNANRLGRTAYAGERAITEYLDTELTVRPGPALKGAGNMAVRATRVLEGNEDDRKTTAHKRLLKLVKGGTATQ